AADTQVLKHDWVRQTGLTKSGCVKAYRIALYSGTKGCEVEFKCGVVAVLTSVHIRPGIGGGGKIRRRIIRGIKGGAPRTHSVISDASLIKPAGTTIDVRA